MQQVAPSDSQAGVIIVVSAMQGLFPV